MAFEKHVVPSIHGMSDLLDLISNPGAFENHLQKMQELQNAIIKALGKYDKMKVLEKSMSEAQRMESDAETLLEAVKSEAKQTREKVRALEAKTESELAEVKELKRDLAAQRGLLTKARNALAEDRKEFEEAMALQEAAIEDSQMAAKSAMDRMAEKEAAMKARIEAAGLAFGSV